VPGKHAPESPTSFYLSVARAVGGALVVLGVVALIALAAVGSNKKPQAKTTSTPRPRTTATATQSTSTAATTTPSPSAAAHPVSKVTVNVLNATQRAGLAASVAGKLDKEGYQIKTVDNCRCGTQNTTIYYRGSAERADAQALLRAHPEFKRVAPATSDIPNAGAFLTVVLGSDYSVS